MASHARLHSRYAALQHHKHPHTAPIIEVLDKSQTTPDVASIVELVTRATSDTTGYSVGNGPNPTIPIAVGLGVPAVVIILGFFWLHRRHRQKLAAEEQLDRHKSLDFGLATKATGSSSSKEMGQVDFEKSIRRGRGLSLDIGSPYILPPEVQGSRESLNSLSRNIVHESHDPYRTVNSYYSTNGSTRSSTLHDDNASFRSHSTRNHRQDGMSSPLVSNAQRMPFSSSPSVLHSIGETQTQDVRSQSRSPLSSPPMQDNYQHDNGFVQQPPAAYMPEDRTRTISPKPMSPSTLPAKDAERLQSPPQGQNAPVPNITIDHDHFDPEYYDDFEHQRNASTAGDHQQTTQHLQHANLASPLSEASEHFYTPTEEVTPDQGGLGVSHGEFDNRRLSVLRPLPPDDPSETPAQRANRIRSFYKEYFNDNDARVYQAGANDYYEDYGSEYLGDGTIYDPQSGQFVVGGRPFAEPITRRAMTPPPRGPPRRFDGAGKHSSAGSSNMPYRARAFSSASAGGVRVPKPRAPPPGPLRNLPTPHLLKEDAFSLPIDFAPPVRIRDQAAGRAASPKMESRPFAPQVAIASPLASSFMEMPAMPSPHHLRRSGTFTALDFAPPPRFRDADGGSDAGSIRSGRSDHSTSSRRQVHNIRAGAYRVSRIPKELVGTQGEFADILKPTWKVGS